jgi:beta-1,4-N-acetylglucosaminyltransferase
LTEMLSLMEAFEGHDFFFVTNRCERTGRLPYRKYLIKPSGSNLIRLIANGVRMIKTFHKEKPEIIISTGAEIAIPALLVGKLLFSTKTIFIESWCRVNSKSRSGRILYPIADLFLVQWPQLVGLYGDKARFEGAVI